MRRALALSLMGLAAAVFAQKPDMRLEVLREDPSAGFAQASRPRAFEFPRDHGPHPAFRHEWWYVTGHLDAPAGERFGFELTFFRYALAAPGNDAVTADASAWRTRQIYFAHFAVTDLQRRQFRFSERFAREALGIAGAQSAPARVWIEDWRLDLDGSSGVLRAASDHHRIQLDLRPLLDPVLNGERGLSRKSAGAASYYYSVPRIAVRGQIARAGEQPLDVTGLAWLDREWGSGALGPDQQGWDWFALQLEDGSALMFYALRGRDGNRDPNSAGTWIAADGRSRPLRNEEVKLDVLEYWDSPHGGTYPSAWRLRIPAIELDLAIRPLLPDQELLTRPRYWEGAVAIGGWRASGKIDGRGYVELVGYAKTD